MRTTITLDDDVAIKLYEIKRELNQPFKTVVNTVLRKGIMVEDTTTGKMYETPTLTIGMCRYPDIDNIAELLEAAEQREYK